MGAVRYGTEKVHVCPSSMYKGTMRNICVSITYSISPYIGENSPLNGPVELLFVLMPL